MPPSPFLLVPDLHARCGRASPSARGVRPPCGGDGEGSASSSYPPDASPDGIVATFCFFERPRPRPRTTASTSSRTSTSPVVLALDLPGGGAARPSRSTLSSDLDGRAVRPPVCPERYVPSESLGLDGECPRSIVSASRRSPPEEECAPDPGHPGQCSVSSDGPGRFVCAVVLAGGRDTADGGRVRQGRAARRVRHLQCETVTEHGQATECVSSVWG